MIPHKLNRFLVPTGRQHRAVGTGARTQGARDAGLGLRPTQLLIFGHPRGGTPLMLDVQQAGIDLPFRALSWQGEDGRVWLAWNDAEWLARRHGLGAASAPAVQAISTGAGDLAMTAAGHSQA